MVRRKVLSSVGGGWTGRGDIDLKHLKKEPCWFVATCGHWWYCSHVFITPVWTQMFHLLTIKNSWNRLCVCSHSAAQQTERHVFSVFTSESFTSLNSSADQSALTHRHMASDHSFINRGGLKRSNSSSSASPTAGGVKTENLLKQRGSLESPTLWTVHWTHRDVLKEPRWAAAAQIFHVGHTERETQLCPKVMSSTLNC